MTAPDHIAAATDYGRQLRPALRTRLKAARVVALNRGRHDLAGQCADHLRWIARAFDNEVPMYVPAIDMLERDCANAKTPQQMKDEYAAVLAASSARRAAAHAQREAA